MKTNYTYFKTTLCLIMLSLTNLQAQTFSWAKGVDGDDFDYAYSNATDASGNVYTTGSFAGTADFDPGPGAFTLTSNGNDDIFIVKLNASGNFVWAKNIGGSGNEVAYGIAIDASGNVYYTGGFFSTVDFDPSASTATLTSNGNSDIFISKLDASGNFVWAKSIGGASADFGYSIVTDASGNVYTAGTFAATADFDPSPATAIVSSAGNDDVFVLKLDASGNYLWAAGIGGAGYDAAYSIAVDALGNVLTTGYYFGSADFDPSAATSSLTSVGTYDAFVSKLSSAGAFVWAKSFGGSGSETGYGICTDALNNVYTTGSFEGICDFDPSVTNSLVTSSGLEDIYVSKLDASGNFVFVKTMGGTGTDIGYSIGRNSLGNIFTTGSFEGTADFDPSAAASLLIAGGGTDVFISELNPIGNFVYAGGIIGAGSNVGYDIAIDNFGNVYTAGYYDGTADFDPSASTVNLTSNTDDDIFMHKLCPNLATLGSVSGATSVCVNNANSYSVAPVFGAVSYSWTLPGGWIGTSTTNTISISPSSNGSFTVFALNACSVTATQTLSLSVVPSPTVSAMSSSSLICAGTSITLTASGADTYTWNPGGVGMSITQSPSVTINYTVTGTNSVTGCYHTVVLAQNVSPCAGLIANGVTDAFVMYPNPSTGFVHITSASVIGKIEVYNTSGKLVLEKNSESTNAVIDLSLMPAGLYFIKASNTTYRIIKE